jgi:chromosome segregation ATPase
LEHQLRAQTATTLQQKSKEAMASGATKTSGSPLRNQQNTNADSPGRPTSPSNTELLSSLQNRAQVFNQLWQAVEKVQGESISIATWKAKLKELEDAKNANKKLSNELKNASGRNAELITHNAALMASREELNRELGLRDGRIEGLGSQLATARDDIQTQSLQHQDALGKEQRAKALTASELRDKIAEVLSARGHITELVSEMQSLKTELLRSKEVSRINTEGIRSELLAAKEHVEALETDKASISKHLWNVTDEIKKLASRLEKAEDLNEERLTHLEETRLKLTELQESSGQTISGLTRDVDRLRTRNEELSDELRMLRRQKDQWEQDQDAQTLALRSELEQLQSKLRTQEKERSGFMQRANKAEKERDEMRETLKNEVDEYKLKLSDERTAHRELRQKMEKELQENRETMSAMQQEIQNLEAARSNQAVTLDELRSTIIKQKERIRELEHASQESDLAMGSVRKKLEQHLQKARREIKGLQEAMDSTNVHHAAEMEVVTDKLRIAEEALRERTEAHASMSTMSKEKEEILVKENYQLRETVGKQNVAIVEERKKNDQLKQSNELLRLDAEREVAGMQGELSRALEQAVKESDKARQKNEEQRTNMSKLETEKREILQEASKLNVELGTQLNEVKNLRADLERSQEVELALKKEIADVRNNVQDGHSMRMTLEQQLKEQQQNSEQLLRKHLNELEVCRKELKFAQKEAAQRVAKFSEHGRAMASDIERLTTKQTELIANLEQRESELKSKTTEVKELTERVNDVKRLRSEVANDLDQARQSLKEERANAMQIREEKDILMKSLDVEKQSRTSGDQSLKIALRQQKKAIRDMEKVEKEKLLLQTQLEREKNVVPPLQANIRAQTQQIKQLEQRMKESVVRHDVAESRAKKQAAELSRDIELLKGQVQNARDATDVELRKRLKTEKDAKEFEGEAQKTVQELMRQLKESKSIQERSEEQLQQQLDTQLEYSSTLKRERDRQIENSKTAAAALREDAETQRRLAGLLEKEKTELKSMLQEKWKEARHVKDRLEEAEAKLYEANSSADGWQQMKRDLETTVDTQKRRLVEIKQQAAVTEDRLGAELKDATSRASQMAAELTTLKHSSLWNDRELGNKLSLLTKEIEVLHGQLQAKDHALERSQQSEIHLKSVAEELKGAAEAMAADMRTKMKEMDGQHGEQINRLRQEMKGLRERSLQAQESMQKMSLEVRARRLESESLSREVKSVEAGSDENFRNLEKAEER